MLTIPIQAIESVDRYPDTFILAGIKSDRGCKHAGTERHGHPYVTRVLAKTDQPRLDACDEIVLKNVFPEKQEVLGHYFVGVGNNRGVSPGDCQCEKTRVGTDIKEEVDFGRECHGDFQRQAIAGRFEFAVVPE